MTSGRNVALFLLVVSTFFVARLEKQLLKDKKAAEMKEVELVKEGVVKDAQVRALQETVARLQSQLHSRDADVER